MMPTPRLRRIALALPLAALAFSGAPAAAAMIHGPSAGRSPAGMAEAAWKAAAQAPAELPANVATLRLGAAQGTAPGTDCTGCSEALASAGRPRPSATLSVNMAILVLGTLWVGLMLRRIQLRSAMEGIRGAGPRHAAGGH